MDIEYLLFLQNIRNSLGGVFDDFFSFITNIAVDYYIIMIPLIIYWVVDKKKGLFIYLTLGLGCIFNALLKSTFCIYRPWIKDARVEPLASVKAGASGYSFPSGHSTCVSSTYSSLAYKYRKFKKLVYFSIFMVLLTMLSRNYVGVHTPQDVIAGMFVGVAATFIIFRIEKHLDKHPEKDGLILILAIIFTIIVLVYVTLKAYPETYIDGVLLVDPAKMRIDSYRDPGLFLGTVLAWYIEKHFIKLDISGTTKQKVMRCVFGILLMVAYYSIVVNAVGKLINISFVYFILRASVPIIFICIYPLFWKKQ